MSTFKVKNLMIDVTGIDLPDIKLCRWFSNPCRLYITDPCRLIKTDWCRPIRTTIWVEVCKGVSLIDNPTKCDGGSGVLVVDLDDLVINPETIEVVRAKMNEVLDGIQVRSVELGKEMEIKTKAQAEVLGKELDAALEEVKQVQKRLG